MNQTILAIDQGTTSTRCIVFDRAGVVSMAQREHRQIFPQAGWVEHDPLEIWQRTQQVLAEATADIDRKSIAAIGITNQRETSVVWNRHTGQPYANAIVWQDTRTKDICDELSREQGIDRFRAITGLPIATYFAGPKIRWLLDQIPDLRRDADRGDAIFGTIDSWLIWNLTGNHVTDVTNASRTMLMNLATLDWDQSMLAALDIPRAMLPKIVPSSDPSAFGSARDLNLPICGVAGDQQAALLGQSCTEPGESKNTYGTGCFLLLHTGTSPVQSKSGLLTTVAFQRSGAQATYALEGSIAVTGSLVQWLRDNLGIIKTSADVETLAASVPDNGGVYFVPAFSGLFAPYWRSDARGTIVGMTRFTNAGHIARAALEATAFQTRDVIDAMAADRNPADSCTPLKNLKVDGGMSINELLMQFQSDLLGVPVIRPKITETTALGAAYAAGLAVGFWKDEAELRSLWREDKQWHPQMNDEKRRTLHLDWNRAIQRSFGWVEAL